MSLRRAFYVQSMFNREELFDSVVNGHWTEVIKLYKEHEDTHEYRITATGDTAIHVAISNGLESVVESLVQLCSKGTLAIRNREGNTPLHLAAKVGSLRICKCIAEKDSDSDHLIGARNKNGETPIFVAVSHGRMSAFLCLHSICIEKDLEYAYYRRNNGDTILHSAISQQHFDIAFSIIRSRGGEKFLHMVNEDGMTPLHLLASKPSCFQSGTHLTGLTKLAYHCLSVPKLNRHESRSSSILKWVSARLQTWGISMNPLRGCGENILPRDEEANEQASSASYSHYSTSCARCRLRMGMWVTKFMSVARKLMLIKGYASLAHLKQMCVWSMEIMNELLERCPKHAYQQLGICPSETPTHEYDFLADFISPMAPTSMFVETPMLIAAKNGVAEMVEGIYKFFPEAIFDVTTEKKNIVMLAVENRHFPMYKFLLKDPKIMKTIFGQVDKDGNSVLHIAANLGDDQRPWRIRGPALEMHMEVKWYHFVKSSMPLDLYNFRNHVGQSPEQLFTDTHQKLMDESRGWLTNYSNSASLVSALIATVAFPTSATIPGGVKQDSGSPTLEDEPFFIISAVSSLLALCFSIIALVIFMVIPTSSFQMRAFRRDLPWKLLVGLISLLCSIFFMLVSFCAGHYFVLKDKLKIVTIPLYAIFCLPLVAFMIAQFLLDFEASWIALKREPQRQRD